MTNDISVTRELIDFIDASPVPFLAVENIAGMLESAGYNRLDPQHIVLEPGQKYFLTRNGSSLLAFRMTQQDPSGFMIAVAHCDSPLFKLKTHHSIHACDRYLKLDTESYGGGILSTWFDRPLSIAGRVIVSKNDALESVPFALDRDLCIIPNTCIHFNKELNSGYTYNPAVDTLPLLGTWSSDSSLIHAVAEQIEVQESDIIASDLYVYNRMKGTILGLNDDYFAAPRIDDLQCVYTALQGLLQSQAGRSIPMFAVFDNEEVGSQTKQGAASDFLKGVLDQIASFYGKTLFSLLPSSLLLSCDNAHALHPNHPEFSSDRNAPHMNDGIVIKHNANQRYATDAVSEALFSEICKQINVPVQHYSNRSDIRGGSTLGSIASALVSMNAIDIGLAQLAMHSSYEVAGVRDSSCMIRACCRFFESAITCANDTTYKLV